MMDSLTETNYEDLSDYTDYPTYPASLPATGGGGGGSSGGTYRRRDDGGHPTHEASIVEASSSGTKHVLFAAKTHDGHPLAANEYHSVASNGHRKSSVNNNSHTYRRKSEMEDLRGATKVGIYGWRKRCLYLLILGLMVMVIVNLALTLWVLKVMEFSAEGMGQLRIVTGGIQLSGQTMVLDALIASTIRSRKGQPISIESSRNFTIQARDSEGKIANRIFLGNGKLECLTRGFRVTDSRGGVLFSADPQEVVVGAQSLRVTGEGGAIFGGTVQTPLVRADSGNELRLESPTRSLEVRAPLGVAILSRAGDISASCLTDLKLQSVAGAIRLDSASIFLPNLKTASMTVKVEQYNHQTSAPSRAQTGVPRHDIYQLCVCANGKLFLSPPESNCVTEADPKVCR